MIFDGYRNAPNYEMLTDKNGNMREQFRAFDGNDPFRQKQLGLLDKLQGQADAEGPTDLSQRMIEQENVRFQEGQGKLAAQGQANFDQGQTNLMMRGGLGNGTRERMAMQHGRDMTNSGQGMLAEHNSALRGIDSQDAQYKQGLSERMLQNYGVREGMDQKLKDLDRSRAMGEHQNKYKFQMQGYQADMQAKASKAQADATRDAGKK